MPYQKQIEQERIDAILSDAAVHMYAGMINDREALEYAIETGLVRRSYTGVGGFMGLATIELVKE